LCSWFYFSKHPRKKETATLCIGKNTSDFVAFFSTPSVGDRGDEGLHDPELGLRILIPLEGTWAGQPWALVLKWEADTSSEFRVIGIRVFGVSYNKNFENFRYGKIWGNFGDPPRYTHTHTLSLRIP